MYMYKHIQTYTCIYTYIHMLTSADLAGSGQTKSEQPGACRLAYLSIYMSYVHIHTYIYIYTYIHI